MSTRSVTILRNHEKWNDWKTGEVVERGGELMRFYRHCDGYPDGHGLEMAVSIVSAKIDGVIDNRNWCAAMLGRFLMSSWSVNFETSDGIEHGDIEYIYVVEGLCDYTGGREGVDDCSFVRITVWKCRYDEGYEKAMSKEPLFSGTPYDYIKTFDEGESKWAYGGCRHSREEVFAEIERG